jgi:hypothetical protein
MLDSGPVPGTPGHGAYLLKYLSEYKFRKEKGGKEESTNTGEEWGLRRALCSQGHTQHSLTTFSLRYPEAPHCQSTKCRSRIPPQKKKNQKSPGASVLNID